MYTLKIGAISHNLHYAETYWYYGVIIILPFPIICMKFYKDYENTAHLAKFKYWETCLYVELYPPIWWWCS